MNKSNIKDYDIDEIVQAFRQIKVSQLRRQLERDMKHNPDRYIAVAHFINLAKEQM